ncbi:MAG: hypothetical protein MZV64_38170 [Ignavibacteriales bacterium]|nr:hypothetical protein [Ignavibacteriales bacterium]
MILAADYLNRDDDKMDFIKEQNLVYFYDDGVSSEWPDGKDRFFGVMMFKNSESKWSRTWYN